MNAHDILAEWPTEVANNLNTGVLATLKEATGGGFLRVLGTFLRNLPVRTQALNLAWQTKDQETLKQNAHKLKGTAAIFGADQLSTLCAELERHCQLQPAIQNDRTIPLILDKIRLEETAITQSLQYMLQQALQQP